MDLCLYSVVLNADIVEPRSGLYGSRFGCFPGFTVLYFILQFLRLLLCIWWNVMTEKAGLGMRPRAGDPTVTVNSAPALPGSPGPPPLSRFRVVPRGGGCHGP